MSKSRQYFPSVTLKTLYNSLFLPYINYCNLIWDLHMPPTLNSSIYSKRKPFELSRFLLQELVLNLFSRSLIFFLSIHFINFMFLVLYSHSLIAFYLPLFPRSSTLIVILIDYLTRSRFNLHKMSLRYQFAISSQAPTIWNDIPLTARDSLTTTCFKKKLKRHFLSLN